MRFFWSKSLGVCHEVGVGFSTVICLHRITDCRAVRPVSEDVELLVQLCDKQAMGHNKGGIRGRISERGGKRWV
ncbi:hypothetical protein FRC18_011765 [Serendipita sp. 400]|nr:hypothetical protein FRC18_011765 [Serendipita sp. 400]